MEYVVHIASGLCLLFGVFFSLTGAIGLLRFPDFFTRTHAASLIDAFGLPLVALGAVLHFGFTFASMKVLVLMVIAMTATSTASHVLAKAALAAGLKPMDAETAQEKLKPYYKK